MYSASSRRKINMIIIVMRALLCNKNIATNKISMSNTYLSECEEFSSL